VRAGPHRQRIRLGCWRPNTTVTLTRAEEINTWVLIDFSPPGPDGQRRVAALYLKDPN